MALACGCEIRGGMAISRELVRKHYKHTFEALLFWELIHRRDSPQTEDHAKLSQARIDLFNAIDKLYPEASGEGS